MTAPQATRGIARYGVPVNPFTRRPLDPLLSPDDRDWLMPVGGLKQIERILLYIERAADAGEPAFVLISGPKGSGRTSVCNRLLAHYRNHRQSDGNEFKLVVPPRDYEGRDPHIIFQKWIKALYLQLKRRKLTPLKDDEIDLDADVKSGEELKDATTYDTTALYWMSDISRMLEAKDAGFGVCIENVESEKVVQAAFSIFGESATLVILTALDDNDGEKVRKRYIQQPATGRAVTGNQYEVLELKAVRGEEASALIESRWARAAEGVKSPFDPKGLKKAFDELPAPTGRVLLLTEMVFDHRVEVLKEGLPWPDDPALFFDADELCGSITFFDKKFPE